MGFHHVALATNNTEATHRFYTEVMGFELVKVVASETPNASQAPNGDGFSKHFFYSTAGTDPSQPESGDPGMIAFWEIHDPAIGTDFSVDINKTAGLPWWVNHIAFDAPTRESLDAHRRALARARPHGARGRPRVLRQHLHPRPQRQHGRVLPHDTAVHRRRAGDCSRRC